MNLFWFAGSTSLERGESDSLTLGVATCWAKGSSCSMPRSSLCHRRQAKSRKNWLNFQRQNWKTAPQSTRMQAGEKNTTNVDDTYNLRTSAVLLQRHLIEYIIITTARRTKQNRGFSSCNSLPISVERATTGSATRGVRRQKSADRQTDRQRWRRRHILQRLWSACDIIIAALRRLASGIAENAVARKDASQYLRWFFRSTTPQILPSIQSFRFFALRYTLHVSADSDISSFILHILLLLQLFHVFWLLVLLWQESCKLSLRLVIWVYCATNWELQCIIFTPTGTICASCFVIMSIRHISKEKSCALAMKWGVKSIKTSIWSQQLHQFLFSCIVKQESVKTLIGVLSLPPSLPHIFLIFYPGQACT